MTSKSWISEWFYQLEVLPSYSNAWEATSVQTQSRDEAAKQMAHYRANPGYGRDGFRLVKVVVTREIVGRSGG